MWGAASAIAAVLMTFFVTTTSWYSAFVFKLVFASLLIVVALQMFWGSASKSSKTVSNIVSSKDDSSDASILVGSLGFIATGAAAGVVSTAAGVGGGIVMVPVYHRLFKMPMIRSVGTSSATIVLVSAAGVLGYAYTGWGLDLAPLSAGYIDVGRAFLLSVPAAFTARLGVQTAHRFNQALLRRSFAIVAILVAIRLLMPVLGFE